MGYSVNGPIVRNGLVLNLDAGYNRSFDGRENLANTSTYNATTWTLPNGNATITTGIDAPDGTNTAIRFTGSNAGNALLRVNHPTVTPNGTDPYTVSFFARLISGSTASNGLSTDWQDLSPSGDYISQLSANNWVRISRTAAPAATTARSFVDIISDTTTNYVIDFWGLQVERSPTVTAYTPTNGTTITRSATTWADMSGNGFNYTFVGGPPYSSSNAGIFTFNGTTQYLTGPAVLPAGQQRYTIDAWFLFNTTNTPRVVWEQNGASITDNTRAALIQIGASWGFNGQNNDAHDKVPVRLNQWVHGVVTVDTTLPVNPIKIYENGVLFWQGNSAGAGGTAANLNMGNSASFIGRKVTQNGEFMSGNIGHVSVYNRVLSATEVAQNFAAFRGRYGI